MKREKSAGAVGASGKRRARAGRKFAGARGDNVRTSADLVLLGALMALASKEAGSASVPSIPAPVNESTDSESFGHAMQAMSGANAEVAMLATLAEDLHRSLTGSFKTLETRTDVPTDPTSIALAQSKYAVAARDPIAVEQVRATKAAQAAKAPAAPVSADASADGQVVAANAPKASTDKAKLKSGKDYGKTADQMREASEDFLESMRQLFDEELEDLIARQEDEGDEVKVADKGGISWLPGLAALGGGGGGGGGAIASAGKFFGGFGIDGYVANATVFYDQNSNFILDAGEISTTTDSRGYYGLNGVTAGVGQIVMFGGVDTSTGGSVGMMATSTNVANSSAAMVTPLTLLMAQGMTEAEVKAALKSAYGNANLDGVNIANYDPISVLEAATGDKATAGAALLAAQQVFAVMNAVSALAEASVSGSSAAEKTAAGQIATLAAMNSIDLKDLVGTNGGDRTVLETLVKTAAPNFAALSTTVANSIGNVNQLIGGFLANPAAALNADVRAAALVSQNDLISQFKAVAQLDPSVAASQITGRLDAFKSVAEIQSKFADIYKDVIAAQAGKAGGVITGVDDIALTVDAQGRDSFDAATLLANDINRAAGSKLNIVGIEPLGLTYQRTNFSPVEVPAEPTSGGTSTSVTNSVTTPAQYRYELVVNPQSLTSNPDGYIKLSVGPYTVVSRIDASDTPALVADRLSALLTKAGAQDLTLSHKDGVISIASKDGKALSALFGDTVAAPELGVAAPSAVLNASIAGTGDAQTVEVSSTVVGAANLKYFVSNGNGVGSGIVRLAISPETQTISLKQSTSSVQEDTEFSLADRLEFTNIPGSGVKTAMSVKLVSITPTNSKLAVDPEKTGVYLEVGTQRWELGLGKGRQITELKTPAELQALLQNAKITLYDEADDQLIQKNFHGSFQLQYGLLSEQGSFNAMSYSGVETFNVVPSATFDTPSLKLSLAGSGFGDVKDVVIPATLTPGDAQSVRFKLEGGDPYETRSITLNNLPVGLVVEVTQANKTTALTVGSSGSVTITEATFQQEIAVKFKANQALLDTQYGLSDPVTILVNHQDTAGASVTGSSQTLQLDVGGTRGLTVVASALTSGLEDVAALIGQLDVATWASDSYLSAELRFSDKNFRIYRSGSELNGSVDGLISGVTRTEGVDSVTYRITSAKTASAPGTFLDGLTALSSVPNFKGGVSVSASLTAYSASDALLATVGKDLRITYAPVADGAQVQAGLGTLQLQGVEDQALSLQSVIQQANITKLDSSEELTYVVRGLEAGVRIVDGSQFGNLSGASLKAAIAAATSIGKPVGSDIELSASQIQNAVFVMPSDRSLATDRIQILAYTTEPGTSLRSAETSPVNVYMAFAGVADGVLTSQDSSISALVNTGTLKSDLVAKAKLALPISASLLDTDGSESMWVRLSVDGNSTLNGFTFSGASSGSLNNGYYVFRGSELRSLRVESSQAFNGQFKIDVASIEGTVSSAADAAGKIIAGGTTVSTTSTTIDVKFLQPASVPGLQFTQPVAREAWTFLGKTYDTLSFKLAVSPVGGDTVTVLMTGVPATLGVPAKFFVDDGVNTKQIGAAAEVAGIWVFNAADFGKSAAPKTIRMVLPKAYSSANGAEFDVTAFAVDALGLTNAKSEPMKQALSNITVAQSVADPIIIDTNSADGALLSLTNTAGGVSYDIDSSGSKEQVGWITSGSDDAFLVLRKGGTSGSWQLITEYLDNNPDTNAVLDLKALAGGDGVLTQAELAAQGYEAALWFDGTARGQVDNAEIAPLTNFSVDLNKFKDTASVDANSGALIAGDIAAGGMTGSYQRGGTQSLAGATLYDVFLPVSPLVDTKQASITKVALDGFEDASDGISIRKALQSPIGESWVSSLLRPGTEQAELESANVLLTVRAKNAGTYFNLSQGARLEGQPTDTWLVLWKPTDQASLNSLKLFAEDNFAGTVPLEFRATVIYNTSSGPVSRTVSRDVDLNVQAVSDRPEISLPSSAITEPESVAPLSISLKTAVSSPDSSEIQTIELTPTSAVPAGTTIRFNNGSAVNVVANQKLSFTGVFTEDSLQLVMPAYASGDLTFKASAISKDGAAAERRIDNLIIPVSVQAVAQPSTMQLSLTNVTTPSVTIENNAKFGVRLTASLVDTDGSEDFASVRVRLTASTPLNGSLPSFEQTTATGTVSSTSQFRLIADGVYELIVPKAGLAINSAGTQAVLSGNVVMPASFDGRFNLEASAASFEKSSPTQSVMGNAASASLTVTPVSDGLSAFQTRAARAISDDKVSFGTLVSSMTLKDADETVSVSFSGIPSGVSLFYRDSANTAWQSFTSGMGGASISGSGANRTLMIPSASAAKLSNLAFSAPASQSSFSLGVSASVTDDSATPVVTTTSAAVQVVPQFVPEVLPATGTGAIRLSFAEAGSGTLQMLVKTGDQQYPSNVDVTIRGVPAGVGLAVPGAAAVVSTGVSQTFTFKASQLARGLNVSTTPEFKDVAGEFALSVTAVADYGVGNDGAPMRQTSTTSVSLAVNPVTDGVAFKSTLSRYEGATWKVADVLSLKDGDGSESLQSIQIKEATGLEVWAGSAKQSFSGGWLTVAASDIDKLVFKAADRFKGTLDLEIRATTQDQARIAGATVNATSLTETGKVTVNIAEAPSSPSVGLAVARARDGLGDGTQIKVTDVARVNNLSDTQVLELVGLSANVKVRVGNSEITPISLRTNDGAPLSAFRLTSAQLASAVLTTSPGSVIALSEPLSFSVRVGTIDGLVGTPGSGTRYAYSKLVDVNLDLRNVPTTGADYLRVGSAAVDGGAGNDIIVAGGVGSAVAGGAGKDALVVSSSAGVVVDLGLGKLITPDGGDGRSATMRDISDFEVVIGSAQGDMIAAGATAATLRGDGGDDVLVGGAGNDVLEGGSGNDRLSGNGGVDKFVLAAGSGSDIIDDFTRNDVIVLAGFGLSKDTSNGLPSEVAITQDGQDWLISLQSGESIRLISAVAEIDRSALSALIQFDNQADFAGTDPFAYAADFPVPVSSLVKTGGNAGVREQYFGDTNDFSDYFQDPGQGSIDRVLGIIADANLGEALVSKAGTSVADRLNLDLANYRGLSGSERDDVLFGLHDAPSVLYGGSGGRDVLAGGARGDVLIATAAKFLVDGTALQSGTYLDQMSGGGGADTFVIDKTAPWDPPTVDETLNAVYGAKFITDFNRAEGDRVMAVGYSTEDIQIGEVNAVTNQQNVTFGGSLTVVFDLSFAREFDSNFTLRMSDFDRY